MPRSSLRRTSRPCAVTGALVLALLVPMTGPAAAEPTPSPSPSPTAEPSPSPSPAGASPSPSAGPSSPLAASLTMTSSAGTVIYGGVVTISGVLHREGAPVVDAPVQVLSRTAGQTSNVVLATLRTDQNGQILRQVSPRTSAEYQLRYGGDALTSPAVSNKAVTFLRPRISGAFSPAGLKLGQTSLLRGSVAPAYSGARVAIRRRLADGSWRDAAVVGITGAGAYSWSVKPGLVGRYVFQVVLPSRPAYLQAATPAMAVQVDHRNLRQGDTGGDVTTLEYRLAEQKADVGRIDGVFDYDLKHAVTSFQKSQGLPRTGVYDAATRVRLGAPVAVRLRYPSRGRAVEIDLTKQVLYLSEAGVLRRIVDISSGNNQPYVSEGVTYRATTPRGSFSIQRKIDGVRVSRLGELYRPAYFYSGWAIHGSKSVPPYPASHGCIRVTNPAQDRLFSLLTIGTPVTVFAS